MRDALINIDVWRAEVYFIWDCDYKEAKKKLKKDGLSKTVYSNLHSDASGMTIDPQGNCPIVWIDAPLESPDKIAILCHEATHVAVGILSSRGMKMTDSSEEAYAYLIEDIVRRVLEANKEITDELGRAD